MEKATDSSIFVNDGSFLERFKQLQEEKGKEKKGDISEKSKSGSNTFVISTPRTLISKTNLEFKANCSRKTTQAPSSGKLAFSLKQKSKLVAPSVKLGEDEDEDEKDAGNFSDSGPMKRPKLDQWNASEQSSKQVDVAYTLSPYQHWWEAMSNDRYGKYGTPATKVICIIFFMLLVLIGSLSDMQHHLPQAILL